MKAKNTKTVQPPFIRLTKKQKQDNETQVTLTIEIPEWAIGWFQTFVDRAYFDTFKDLAENFDEDEAYQLRNAVYAVNAAIIKARGSK